MASIHLQFPWFWVKEILSRSQLSGTDLERLGEVALGKYRVTGANAVIALGHWLHTVY